MCTLKAEIFSDRKYCKFFFSFQRSFTYKTFANSPTIFIFKQQRDKKEQKAEKEPKKYKKEAKIAKVSAFKYTN